MILESFKSLALTTRPYQLRDNRAHEGPCQLQAATACSGSPRRPCGKHPLSLSGTPSFTLWSTTRSDDNHDRLQVQIIMDSLIPFTTSGSLVDCVDSTSVSSTLAIDSKPTMIVFALSPPPLPSLMPLLHFHSFPTLSSTPSLYHFRNS